ncbi:MAG: hypothetical protein ABH863_01790 [Candidatus Micrarchaeota archaeon]
MRAFLSLDVLVSAFISATMLALLFGAYLLLMGSLSNQLGNSDMELHALYLADLALFSCESPYGLAKCLNGAIDSNVLDLGKIRGIRALSIGQSDLFPGGISSASRRWMLELNSVSGRQILAIGNYADESDMVCIRRPAVLENEVVVLKACYG